MDVLPARIHTQCIVVVQKVHQSVVRVVVLRGMGQDMFDPDVAFVIPIVGSVVIRNEFRNPVKDVAKQGTGMRPFRFIRGMMMVERMDDDPVEVPTFP